MTEISRNLPVPSLTPADTGGRRGASGASAGAGTRSEAAAAAPVAGAPPRQDAPGAIVIVTAPAMRMTPFWAQALAQETPEAPVPPARFRERDAAYRIAGAPWAPSGVSIEA